MTVSTSSATGGVRPAPSGSVTLRAILDARLAEGRRFSLDEAIATIVPLIMDVKERHERGELLYVHPSAIAPGPDGMARLDPSRAVMPTNPRDRMCLAPEHQARLDPGNARSSVFSVGAILYELVTGEHIGPAMRRPRDIDPSLPVAFEALLGKALVGDPAHRPEDLAALASAMHHLAPMKSIPPPVADESRLDHTDSFDVDVRLSMLPPAEVVPPSIHPPPGDPFGNVALAPQSAPRPSNDPTARLSALKDRLESDPRPRYVVNKERMDHGPFTAVELLQQIASGQFVPDDGLRDEISGQSQPIKDWEEFAGFAQSAAIHREIKEEKKAVAIVAEQEKKAGLAKSTLGVAVIVGLLAAGGVFFLVRRGFRSDDVDIEDDKSLNVDPAGSIKGKKIAKPKGPGGGVAGNYPGGMSYDEAMTKFGGQDMTIGGPAAGPDLTDAQLQGPINARMPGILGSCGAGAVNVRIAIKNGVAIGVTVSPPNPCVDRGVRGIQWPSNPKTDSLTTNW